MSLSPSGNVNPAPSLDATSRQRLASNPDRSAWVGASAGSGKTKVLTDRMLRLLLPREDGRPGTRPDKILALTFTKAGANEMALRLSQRLSRWAVLPDEKLSLELLELMGRTPGDHECDAARRLFASVVDTPGGLHIMTIHSFCQSILGRFPVEAGLAPGFSLLDEEQAKSLLDRARIEILTESQTDRGSPLSTAIETISAQLQEEAFTALLRNILAERNQLTTIFKNNFGIEGLYTNLCQTLEIAPGTTEPELFDRFCGQIPADQIRALSSAFAAGGGKTELKYCDAIAAFLTAPSPHSYDEYRKIFIKTDGDPRQPSKAACRVMAGANIVMADEAARICAYEDSKKTLACIASTVDLFRIADAVIHRYAKLKHARGMLDYDDLIITTLSLFKGETFRHEQPRATLWVMYKLDEGLDHILIDEAQDTNPEQWEIIALLAAEFFAGEGAGDPARSIFVVGDDKQSIFGFQRAAPEKMGEMQNWFRDRITAAQQRLELVDINISFRSVQTVLDAVDRVFGHGSVRTLTTNYLNHIAHRQGQAGLVELWPLYKTAAPEDKGDLLARSAWEMPDEIVEVPAGSLQLAERIGDTIKHWIVSKEELSSYGRPIAPGDILILVRSRNYFVGQLVRALKSRDIPVSGVDRMILGEQLVVQDLCAAAEFGLLPDDDLTLACLLKSPFLGMSEEALYDLAQPRTASLWQAVKESAPAKIVTWLEKLIATASDEHPYEFFSRLVQEPCPADAISGLHAIRRRLGEDAVDPLEEFLNAALAYERAHTAGLQSFLHWHRSGNSEIKRQSDEAGNAVRIMTVHGAKGLQAPIVFMPDTVRTASSVKTERILWPHKSELTVPYYVPAKDRTPKKLQTVQDRIASQLDQEYFRLLYVGMTRAEERLYFAGYAGKKSPGSTGKTEYWYRDIEAALNSHPRIEHIPSGLYDDGGREMPILRLSSKRVNAPDKAAQTQTTAHPGSTISMEPWMKTVRPEETRPPRPLAPSRPSDDETAVLSPLSGSDVSRFKRGLVTHKLMQILPDLPDGRRRITAEQFLARPALGLGSALQKEIAAEVMAILNHPDFGEIFGPGSLAEVPVSGLLADDQPVSGQIDRVLIKPDEILIIDYKTNRPPPVDADAIPALYQRQMETYAALFRSIYPDRPVRCALLWTDGARLMPVPV